MLEIYSTNNLVEVVKLARSPESFLQSRYMPTSTRDIFKTPEVYIERTDDGNLAAPFVIPYSGSKLMEREGYTGEKMQPAFINPSRLMTVDQLMKKGIGETMYDETTPEERDANYLADDIAYLMRAINRTIEWMCGQIIVHGYVDCKIGDADSTEEVRFQYYDSDEGFNNLMTFTDTWGSANPAKGIYQQVSEAANDIDSEYGDLDLILGANLVTIFLRDAEILKMLDVAKANFGALNPGETQIPGVGYLGSLNFGGKQLNIYSYNAKVKINGVVTSYIDPDYFTVVPRNNFGAVKYGVITQMEEEDREFHTRTGKMVPRRLTDPASNKRTIEMASAPLPHPYALDSWRSCKAL